MCKSYPFLKFKFLVYGLTDVPDIHVHASCNAVTLVWGSLRLTPIRYLDLQLHPIAAKDEHTTSFQNCNFSLLKSALVTSFIQAVEIDCTTMGKATGNFVSYAVP